MKFETLKEQHAKRKPEDLEIDYGIYYTQQLCYSSEFSPKEPNIEFLL